MLSSRMRHRGPDESGVTIGQNFWMGHERLSIVGVDNGHQPIPNKDETIALVCNGEIYNHELLYTTALKNSNIQKTTDSDSEVIIHLYQEFGVECVGMLHGMFGFVLVENGGQKVLAARDKVGVKPLYMGVSHDGSEILFSSELKGIVDQCKELQLIPAGHFWTRETGLVKYWDPAWDADEHLESLVSKKSEQAQITETLVHKHSTAEECKAGLETAVIRRLMSDVEVGLFLSGGVDSSIIGAIMMKHINKLKAQTKIKSFAVGQEGSPDILAARAVAEFLGTDHIECIFTPEMAFDILEKVVYHMETYEPELIRSSIPNYFLAQKTAEHVKVVLTGEGSDEIWSGYLYYHDCPDAQLLQMENRRIFKAVQFVNLQRADRMTMAHGLEARVPFFDVDYVETVMNVNPEEKLCKEGKCEKWMLRKMYEDDIPKEVVWRTKAMQCEGVGMTWVKTLQNYINGQISDDEFDRRGQTFPVNPPQTKEELYYRKVFEKYYPGCQKFIHVWPNGCRAGGAPWKTQSYSLEGLKDVERLKVGHGLAESISV